MIDRDLAFEFLIRIDQITSAVERNNTQEAKTKLRWLKQEVFINTKTPEK